MPTVAITGSNRGIGLALAKQLSSRGDQVFALCRSASPELRALGVQIIENVDVTALNHIQRVSSQLPKLDTLINNAGVLVRDSINDLSVKMLQKQFEVNALGPLLLTKALLPNLGSGSKVVIVTSRMGSIDDNTSGRFYGYRMSKAAVNMAGKSLSNDLHPQGIAVALLHPGYVRTDMTGGNGFIEPTESARGLIEQIDRLTLSTSGSFWHANGDLLPW